MKPTHNVQIDCQQFDNWLAQQYSDELSTADAEKLEAHLQHCPKCSAVALNIGIVPTVLQSEAAALQPKPETQLLLQLHLQQRRKQQPKSSFWEKFSGIFQHRVPLYQAALGIAVVLLVMLLTGTPHIQPDDPPQKNSEFVELADSTMGGNAIDSSQIGRSLYEDSLLAKFFHTIM